MTLTEAPNFIEGTATPAKTGEWLEKLRPADGTPLRRVARSEAV